ncbi:pilus assembly protein TadG-related protein [Pseudoduganella sp. SL102]|uniref:pilus assembly protein TadG-related protein n=1 Tax=Pseudoduganella sp. SL102 TaxID=2995154 RepID=UPI00248BF466|nr:pilus assembly protein TadG-related protein [Pseudoduganella sp. SL102]WBS03285.1 pilus assembly protein TadG-related protein [Pseudoduganella sp. SL102]
MKPAFKHARKPVPELARRPRGVILIMYAVMLTLLLGFTGLVLDLGLVYLRRAQLQAAADTMAITAASMLNGTAAGLENAVSEVKKKAQTLRGVAAGDAVTDVLRFSAHPHAPAAAWLPAGSVGAGAVADMLYARIDIGALGAGVREVPLLLMGIFGAMAPFDVRPVAVAGRRSLNVTPLAICARSAVVGGVRSNKTGILERVSYGFRYGITYNLLRLNPNGPDPVFYYVDPLMAPGLGNEPAATKNTIMAPFMCSGTIAYPRIGTGSLRIARQATFGLATQLNSRLNVYGGGNAAMDCTRDAAPPDTNIKNYAQAGANWHYETPVNTSAEPRVVNAGLSTVADLSPVELEAVKPAPTAYGVRWAYRIPRRPTNVKITGSWDSLYPSTSLHAGPKNYPADAPYFSTNGTTYDTNPVPLTPARQGRRLMYIPLLECRPADGPDITRANVLAYGVFFLTAPASASEIPGEFTGFVTLADEGTLLGDVELIR